MEGGLEVSTCSEQPAYPGCAPCCNFPHWLLRKKEALKMAASLNPCR